jgi:hypothetical protein
MTSMTDARQDVIGRLREIADRLVDQRDEPWPAGTAEKRLHYWRDKAIKAADDLRTLLTAWDGNEVTDDFLRALSNAMAIIDDAKCDFAQNDDHAKEFDASRDAVEKAYDRFNAIIGKQDG